MTSAWGIPIHGLTLLLLGACGDFLTDAEVAPVNPGNMAVADECLAPGAGWIWCDDFDTDRLASYFEHGKQSQFTRTGGVGVGGSYGMRAHFTTGLVDAGNLKLAFGRTPSYYFAPVDAGTADYREVYWRVYFRNQAGWTGGGGAKFSRATVFGSANWAQAAFGHVWSTGPSNESLALDPASGTDAAGALKTTKYNDFDNMRWLGIQRGTTPIFDENHVGRWYCIEFRMKLNDAGASNGIFQMWIDGALEAQSMNLNWLGAYRQYAINAVFLENYWNGGSPQEQDRFFDNFVVSTQPIGCGAS